MRSLKYVLHCRHNHEHDPEQYLTPTQRAARRIRELKVSERKEKDGKVKKRELDVMSSEKFLFFGERKEEEGTGISNYEAFRIR